jgi:DNA polymerase I-like protein with 3'-5' exonuclease and polymerase domains
MDRITSSYLHALQAIYYDIGDRGIRVDTNKVELNKLKVRSLIQTQLDIASKQWGIVVYIGTSNNPGKDVSSVNLNSTSGEASLLKKMQEIGYHVPKITKKNEEGEYEQKYSTGELALQKMLTENQFKYPAGDPAIRAILKVRELGKLQNGYLNARFCPRTIEGKTDLEFYFLSTYNVAGTVTGRRGSKRHTFGWGNNAQNFPKHSESASLIRECLVPREGNIFLMVDQMQAEEWPVSALSGNIAALDELRAGVDRHARLASKVFDEKIPEKSSPEWNESLYGLKRYLGKKIKHARNYGMKEKRMSESLAQEGFAVNVDVCKILLDKAAAVDPSVDLVFHKYVQQQVAETHMLKTPFGRERMFLGARPNADNNTLFNEAYSYIPQSTVGDNTGFAVSFLEQTLPIERRAIVQEGHDSIVQDIPAKANTIFGYLERTVKSFDRTIRFHNGIEVKIPVEAELGYDFETTVTLKSLDLKGIEAALEKLEQKRTKKKEEVAA